MQNDVWHMAAGLDSGKAVPTDAVHLEEEVLECEAVTLSLSAELQQYVAEAVEAFAKFKSVTSTKAFHFDRFGEQEVKSSWGRDFNPDGILHMAFQLTYYRLHGRSDISIYSAASTKAFRKGRTEAVRCTSEESVAFATRFDSEPDAAVRRELLREAVAVHRQRGREAGQGLGVDRHLFSLSNLLGDEEEPMYGEAWAAHQKSILSTSNCSLFGPSIVTPGFGAVCDDGCEWLSGDLCLLPRHPRPTDRLLLRTDGLGYCINQGFIDICVTNFTGDPGTGGAGFGGVTQAVEQHAFDTSAERFAEGLGEALLEIRELVLATG